MSHLPHIVFFPEFFLPWEELVPLLLKHPRYVGIKRLSGVVYVVIVIV
jgi:hypothetical protein